jgi:hypothetical protein
MPGPPKGYSAGPTGSFDRLRARSGVPPSHSTSIGLTERAAVSFNPRFSELRSVPRPEAVEIRDTSPWLGVGAVRKEAFWLAGSHSVGRFNLSKQPGPMDKEM